MRILWLNWRDIKNPEAGGAEVLTHALSRKLVERNHDVTLFTASFQNSLDSEIIDNVTIIRKGGKFSVYKEAEKYYKKNKNNFDVVIDEINVKPFLTPKYVKEKPIVTLIHQISPEQFTSELPFPLGILGRYYLEKKWLSYYHNVLTVTVSNSTKISLEKMGFKNIKVIQEGLNVKPLDEPLQKYSVVTVTFIGRLKKHKLPHHAIRAFEKIKRTFPTSHMYVIGDGYMLEKLKKTDIQDISFVGHINEKEKYEILGQSHLVLVPATREGWGLVVVESNAMGTPVIAYNVPGLVDSVQNNVNGLLVEKNTPDYLADTAISLLRDQNRLNALSKSSLNYSRKFDWNDTASEFEQILRDMV